MTNAYTCRGRSSESTAHFALPWITMKWTHRICFKHNFLSEWQAVEDACELAMLFDYYTSTHFTSFGTGLPSTSTMRVGRVHFDDSVEVVIGDDDLFEPSITRMPEVLFHDWTEKPWSLRNRLPSLECRTTDAFHDIPSRCHGSDDEPQDGEPDFPDDAAQDGNFDAHEPPEPQADLRGNMPDEDAPSPDDGDFSSDEDPQALHVFRLGRPHVFGHVDWRTYHTVLRDVARLVRMPLNVLTGFHHMQVRLDGLHDMEEAIILQHINDIAIGSNEKLVVFDIVMHTRPLPGQAPVAPVQFTKSCISSPDAMSCFWQELKTTVIGFSSNALFPSTISNGTCVTMDCEIFSMACILKFYCHLHLLRIGTRRRQLG